jgi:hypothetical protein
VTQNASYDFTDIDRERINGQLVMQAKPTDNLSMTVDYTYSQNTVKARTNSIGVWFNHNDTTSSWTSGPAAGPNFYSEAFGAGEAKDLAITGAVSANRTINRSLGGNIEWHPGNLAPGARRAPFDRRKQAHQPLWQQHRRGQRDLWREEPDGQLHLRHARDRREHVSRLGHLGGQYPPGGQRLPQRLHAR